MITAPYNFVPLSEKVFYPDNWEKSNHKISHDIPFYQSLSGEVTVLIEAKTPIFIADHNNDNKFFCKYGSNYYIPATSFKGLARNLLEIMSFSKITTEDKKYSYRDIDNQAYKNKLISKQRHIACGWLYQDNDTWKIIELGNNKQFKITHAELAGVLENKFVRNFPNLEQKNKTPDKKYAKYGSKFEHLVTIDKKHVAVFTGTVDDKNDKEFKFPYPVKTENDLVVSPKVEQAFIDAYYIGKPDESKVWKTMWKREFNNNGFVPVFYLKENEQLLHFGLSLLYKLPFEKSVHQGIHKSHKSEKLDTAETIFGFVEDKLALKGRVQFGHLVGDKNIPNHGINMVKKILNSPKPSYYPTYIDQNCDSGIKTMDNDFTISGWKKYIVKKSANTSNEDNGHNKNVIKEFYPLPIGTLFRGKIRYHNLRLFELGALLSAITLHANNDKLFPNIGMAKSHGFGSIKIDLLMDSNLYTEALVAYEKRMEEWSGSSWLNSPQLKELFHMMRPIDDPNGKFTYQDFKYYGEQKKNEIGSRDCAEKHSHSFSEPLSVRSLQDDEDINAIKVSMDLLREEIEKKDEEEQLRYQLLQEVPKNTELNENIKIFIKREAKDLSYFDINHFGNYLLGKFDNIPPDIVDAYETLYDSALFREVEELLTSKAKGRLGDIDKAKLYKKIKSTF